MEFERAQIVRSLAGHDKGEVFCVLDAADGYLLLADGKARKLEAPKRKKARHAACAGAFSHPTLRRLAGGEGITDSEIRRALAAFRAEFRRV